MSGSVYELSSESRVRHFTIRGYAASRPAVTGGWPEPGLDARAFGHCGERGLRTIRQEHPSEVQGERSDVAVQVQVVHVARRAR
jgi:hypothetical protein